jgi:hypothetical protein
MSKKRDRYIVLDTDLEMGFATGDTRVVAYLTGKSFVCVDMKTTDFIRVGENGRYIVLKNPRIVRRRQIWPNLK